MCASGLHTPQFFRLLETGKSKAWDGASGTIIQINRDTKELLEAQQAEYKARQKKVDYGGEKGTNKVVSGPSKRDQVVDGGAVPCQRREER